MSRRQLGAIVVLAMLPDIPQLFPLIAWAAATGALQSIYDYALASPGTEPWLPPLVQTSVHHLHCVAHSAVVAGTVTLLVWRLHRQWLVPILGWWSHIVIDTFSHSADFYAVPVLYPFTYRGFDGVAWNTPTFMLINYLTLAAVCTLLLCTRNRTRA